MDEITPRIEPRTEPPPMMLVWADVYQAGRPRPSWLIGSADDVYAALDDRASGCPYGMAARLTGIASYS